MALLDFILSKDVLWVKGDGNAPPADIVAWFRESKDVLMADDPVPQIFNFFVI